jgi:hypothetical protein
VLAAIRADELYVFTHPDMRGAVDERFAAIQTAMDRVAAQEGYCAGRKGHPSAPTGETMNIGLAPGR